MARLDIPGVKVTAGRGRYDGDAWTVPYHFEMTRRTRLRLRLMLLVLRFALVVAPELARPTLVQRLAGPEPTP